jgi:hypothetical protein
LIETIRPFLARAKVSVIFEDAVFPKDVLQPVGEAIDDRLGVGLAIANEDHEAGCPPPRELLEKLRNSPQNTAMRRLLTITRRQAG